MRNRANRVLEVMPGWADVVGLPDAELRRAVTNPEVRARMKQGAEEAVARGLGAMTQWNLVEVAEATSPDTAPLVGRTIADLAAERRIDTIDVLIDTIVPNRLPIVLVFPSLEPTLGDSDEGWAIRARVWKDDRVVLGGSDAGAHLDLMCHANYTTSVLANAVRRRGLLTLEEAVRQLTDVPARLYGLRDRGRLAEGWLADLVVFDPERVDTENATTRYDLPGGNLRLYAESTGVEHVFVNGREVVTEGKLAFAPDLDNVLKRGSERALEIITKAGLVERTKPQWPSQNMSGRKH
jgi:N-acyl-D-aspartate/D-glutamate deacylase